MVSVDFTILIQWINFGILLFILYWILYKPLIKFLDERNAKLKQEIESAREGREAAERLKSEYQDRILQLKMESFRYVEEASKEAERAREAILREARQEAEKVIAGTREEIGLEAQKLREELRDDLAGLAVSCASRVLGREVKEADHKKMIQDFLKEETKRG